MNLDFKIGWAIINDFIISSDIMMNVISEPFLIKNDSSFGKQTNLEIFDFFLGVGLTYYIMPRNYFLNLSLGVSQLDIDISNQNLTEVRTTNFGPSLRFKIGKERWVGDNWALGIGLFYYISSIHDDKIGGSPVDVNYRISHFGIVFITTFN